ncbi:NAD(P)-binding Rossmann-fold superfamily protein [Zea mays]|uniref:NAD(P)-binding Rossmann-fold superfamily protein n=1 Tax=Zea mays TaxID=4577 RepID=A0A1D6PBN2_MAIZE|nr:NAD(P)-binding Rossmann-fold superfamily protein [Zea mays]
MTDDKETAASTRLSLRLGHVGVMQSSSYSSSSGAAVHPRHIMLTEAEKEAKRLRRVLANWESARQTILRRQAITSFPSNSSRLLSVHAAVSLFSAATGAPLASVDGSALTLLRTAAVSALAAPSVLVLEIWRFCFHVP